MRYIGLDLAQTTSHKALGIDERGQIITPVLSVKTSAISLEQPFQRAREAAPTDEPLIVVMEPTGMAWFPIAVFCQQQGKEDGHGESSLYKLKGYDKKLSLRGCQSGGHGVSTSNSVVISYSTVPPSVSSVTRR